MGPLYIGLMSGTSLDGLDAVLVELLDEGQRPRLIEALSRPIPHDLHTKLLALTAPGNDEIPRMGRIHVAFGRFSAELCLDLLRKANVAPTAVDAIGSHGQTIRHHPLDTPPFTLQVGDPNTLAQLTGITTVADFRLRDMAVGGEGAPLVPAFHAALLGYGEAPRALLNIGGMANLTLIPGGSEPVRGFDCGPGNILLDAWVQRHRQQPFDAGGAWGAGGSIHLPLLTALLAEPYFARTPPKSTGRELFNLAWLERQLAAHPPIAAQDVQATLCELTAQSISDALARFAPEYRALWVCGGGAYNNALMGRLSALSGIRVASTLELGVEPRWMEASAFAWLARETLFGRPGNLPAVTGADRPVILGGVYPGQGWRPPLQRLDNKKG